MPPVTVLAVTSDDIDDLVTSVAGLFREDAGQRDPTVDLSWPARHGAEYYTAMISNPACLLVLARDGHHVIGHLAGRLNRPSSIQTEAVAVLESMRVAPESRRAGAGSLLVQYFFTWARDLGAHQASVTAYAANDVAQRFYERHGFTPKSVTSRVAL
jgi:GNAT superfamily N-acetyltransferase